MHEITLLIERYGLVVVFLNMLLDQAGLPLPIYPTLILAAALNSDHGWRIPEIVLVGVAGSLMADTTWYWAGRRYGRLVLSLLCRLSLSPDSCVRQTESMFSRVGVMALFVAKFVPGLSIISIVLSALSGASLLTFLTLDTLGATVFVGMGVLLGIVFRNAVFSVLATLASLGGYGLALVALALALYVFARWAQRQLFIRQLRMDRISAAELAQMLDRGETPLILDVRSKETRLLEGIIPGAIFAHPDEARDTLKGYPPHIEIIVYCSCPNEASAAVAAVHLRRAGFRKIRPLLGGIEAWAAIGRPIEILTETLRVVEAPVAVDVAVPCEFPY
jgi:membrane protein DedA with SNARE-associated domain/rhodanese-related sulfurtransferase